MTGMAPGYGPNPAEGMVRRWLVLREAAGQLEAADHPDLVDAQGRRWEWIKDDLWRHGSKAWPRCLLPEPVVEAA